MLVHELKPIVRLYLFHWLKTSSCSPNACAYSPDYVILMRSTGCVMQCERIALTVFHLIKVSVLSSACLTVDFDREN